MNSKASGIYSITSKTNGKRYIGSANRICDRWKTHIKSLQNNKHVNQHLQSHFNKHGVDDFLFAVVEVVEKGDLSLQDFKDLLLEREQVYLDNWEECHFNIKRKAKSSLGHKHTVANYYCYHPNNNSYGVYYNIDGKSVSLGHFDSENEAITHVDFIKSLSDLELKNYWETNHKEKRGRSRKAKHYCFHKSSGMFRVMLTIDSQKYTFGIFKNEEDAINEVSHLKTLSDKDKLLYHESMPKRIIGIAVNTKRKNKKYYSYCKTTKKWQVRFNVDGKTKRYGYYLTEEEARQKVEQVKQELGGFD